MRFLQWLHFSTKIKPAFLTSRKETIRVQTYKSIIMEIVPDFTIRNLLPSDASKATNIWKEIGLVDGFHSVETFLKVDPTGIFGAVTSDGELLGICSGVVQNKIGFLGMYAVRPQYQGQGVGTKLWAAAMDHVANRNAGVNAVPGKYELYRDKAGFGVDGGFACLPYHGSVNPETKLIDHLPGMRVQTLDADLKKDVLDYDASLYLFRREALSLTLDEEGTITHVAINSENQVCGFGAIRPNILGGALIGPLYCNNVEIAELLVSSLVEAFPIAKENLTYMGITGNPNSLKLAEKIGLSPTEEVPRLYRTAKVHVPFPKIFSQHNLNFCVF